ncbi:GID complex containing RING finger motif [Salix suchowensis]|nr:GID complex containing RING finger motif [Salix suchowensis]
MAIDVSKRATIENAEPADTVNAIDTMIARVEALKRKLSDLQETTGKPAVNVLRERVNHVAVIEGIQSSNSPEFDRWTDTRFDRWVVDWFLRNGKEKSARHLAQEKHIEPLVDIDLFMDIRRIEDALSHQSCTEALAWCSENKTALRKIKSTLEFELRLQEYIELARARRSMEAIAYSKKYLVSWHETHLDQIHKAIALLAFPPTTTCGPTRRAVCPCSVVRPSRWSNLIRSFRLAIYTLNTLPTEPLLHLALYAGLGLGKLAAEVPFSHHVNSTIVCAITGRIMDADNMPMAFPNGYVYSREVLEDMAAKNRGMVTCPRTGETCQFAALRKVYIS